MFVRCRGNQRVSQDSLMFSTVIFDCIIGPLHQTWGYFYYNSYIFTVTMRKKNCQVVTVLEYGSHCLRWVRLGAQRIQLGRVSTEKAHHSTPGAACFSTSSQVFMFGMLVREAGTRAQSYSDFVAVQNCHSRPLLDRCTSLYFSLAFFGFSLSRARNLFISYR